MPSRRFALIAWFATALLLAPWGSVGAQSAYDICDVNRDGRIDEKEKMQCAQAYRDRCDLNGDGVVTEAESRECSTAKHPCDFDGDGLISEREKAECSAETSKDAYFACREHIVAMQSAQEDFKAHWETAWKDFALKQQRAYEEFSQSPPTDDQWRAFKADQEAQRQAFASSHEEAKRDFEARFAAIKSCLVEVSAQSGSSLCRPLGEDEERFARAMAMREAEAKSLIESKTARFAAYQVQQKESFMASGPNETEKARFAEHQQRERALFETEIAAEALRLRTSIASAWQEFKAHALSTCVVLRHAVDAHEDARAAWVECRLKAQAKIDAFVAAKGPESSWSEGTRTELRALKATITIELAHCQDAIESKWRQDFDEENAKRSDRYGHFTFTSTGNGSGHVKGKYLDFDVEVGSIVIRDYRVAGRLLFDEFMAPHHVGEPRIDGAVIEGEGRWGADACVQVESDGCHSHLKIRILDDATGMFAASCRLSGSPQAFVPGHPATCTLRLADGGTIERQGSGESLRYKLTLGDRVAYLYVRGPHNFTGGLLELQGDLKVWSPAANAIFKDVANKNRNELDEALADGRVVAEVDASTDRRQVRPSPAREGSINATVERRGLGVSITFDAERPEAGTFVFNLDPGLFGRIDLANLPFAVTYYEVAEDGSELKVRVTKASSLADILVADEDHPEYWIVQDKDGVQVLVSNPHFSTKRIEIEPLIGVPNTIPGLEVLGILGALGLAGVMVRRRQLKS